MLFSKTSDFLLNYRNSLDRRPRSAPPCASPSPRWPPGRSHRMRWPRWVPHVFLGWALVFHMIPPIALAGAWFTMARHGRARQHLHRPHPGAHRALNLPMALWLMGVFVREVPRELEEAARIDGASTPVLLWKVVLPLIAPGLAATGDPHLRVQLE